MFSVLDLGHWVVPEDTVLSLLLRMFQSSSPSLLTRQQMLPSGISRLHRPLLHRAPAGIVHAAKGFGKTKRSTKDDVVGGSKKVKRVNVRPPQPKVPASMADVAVQQYDALEAAKKQAAEEAEFAARLELIKAEAAQKKAAGLAPSAAPEAATAAPRAVFDAPAAPEEDIYSNPPSIMNTLQEQLQSDINDPALRQAKIGPSQLGLAGGAILFGLVFVLVSGGDFATTNRYKGLRPANPPPDPIEMSRLARQAEGFEARVESDPSDLQSLEAAAVTYARMQDYSRAAELLDKLTSARPGDVEAWRLLGESRLLNADAAKSVTAYEKAIALSPNNQTVITGLVDAYVANSQQAKAVKYLTDLRDKILAQVGADEAAAAAAAPAAAVADAASSSGSGAADTAESPAATAAAMPGSDGTTSADATATSSSSSNEAGEAAAASTSDRVSVDPIAVQLLLGKSYAAWRGHDQDALAAYDTLIGAFPTDFRGYLAKGMFLRERGRQGDAERMFLQAKFYAPESMQAFVADRAGERTVIEPLPDNGLE